MRQLSLVCSYLCFAARLALPLSGGVWTLYHIFCVVCTVLEAIVLLRVDSPRRREFMLNPGIISACLWLGRGNRKLVEPCDTWLRPTSGDLKMSKVKIKGVISRLSAIAVQLPLVNALLSIGIKSTTSSSIIHSHHNIQPAKVVIC